MLMHKNPNREKAAVLDIACGPEWPQLTVMHSNGCAPGYYMGVDLRDCRGTMPIMKKTLVGFDQVDVTKGLPNAIVARVPDQSVNSETGEVVMHEQAIAWDMIVCFEVLEHMPKESGIKLLDNIQSVMTSDTLLLFSTPVFDPGVGMADNHIYEWGYEELKEELSRRFDIVNHYGTFASLKDYVPTMTPEEIKVLEKLKEYYNTAVVSCMMAPLYPQHSRNVLWQLKVRQ
jgi:hypothetical protein